MANQQILTGNVLQDGITYHASDINAAINNAVLLEGAIGGQGTDTPSDSHTLLLSNGTNLRKTTLLQVKNSVMLNNIATTGNANIRYGVSFSGGITTNISGSQNDYSPPNFDTATWLHLHATSPATITGMAAPSNAGTLKVLSCSAGTITFNANDAASAITNRMVLGNALAAITLSTGGTITFLYFGGRWRLISYVQ